MADLNHTALIARKRARLGEIRTSTGLAVARIWNAMPNHGAHTQAAFTKQAVPVVRAGQDKAISLQLAFLGLLTGVTPKIDRSTVLDDAAVDLTSPFSALGHALNDGQSIADALELGASVAETLGQDAVQWAARSSAAGIDHSEQITGWERIPDGNACDWCIEVAGQTYRTAESAAFGHSACGCDVSPLTQDRPQGYEASAATYADQQAG